MPFYIFSIPLEMGSYTTLWEINGDKAVRLDVHNAADISGGHCTAEPGQSTVDAILDVLTTKDRLSKCSYWKLNLDAGQYYARMARPFSGHNLSLTSNSPGNNPGASLAADAIAMALGQLEVLTGQLASLCQTVHPAPGTLDTYGHAIRNLLILACTEVETHWRGVLNANGLMKERYTTKDYCQLQEAMRLGEYSVDFPYYPWLPSIAPFAGWSPANPTQSLVWYNAYNAVKHNREDCFAQATLRHAFEAISACAILILAQYGRDIEGWKHSNAARFFNFKARPKWLETELYTLNLRQKHANSATENWIAVPYPFMP